MKALCKIKERENKQSNNEVTLFLHFLLILSSVRRHLVFLKLLFISVLCTDICILIYEPLNLVGYIINYKTHILVYRLCK